MKFEKRNFMGIELDVLVGHPEHDLLFVASQVAKASGLRNSPARVNKERERYGSGRQLVELFNSEISLKDIFGSVPNKTRAMRKDMVMFAEPEVYGMLLRSKAPQTEAFRKWVTEEVLPTIRKTGKYDAEQSTNPIALGVMDELKALRGAFLREIQSTRWVLALLRERRSVLGRWGSTHFNNREPHGRPFH